MMPGRAAFGLSALLALSLLCTPARADDDETTREAKAAFERGTDLVQRAQWAEALGAFERAQEKRPHPVTLYNVAACEQALGRYTRARATFERALADDRLPAALASEARAFVSNIDRLLAQLTITLAPESAQVVVDGRPLAAGAQGAPFIAGTRPPGPAEPAPGRRFVVVLDPGAHVISFSRKGFTDAIVNRTLAPGSRTDLTLELDRLPATLRVESDAAGAVVTVDGADVGSTPTEVQRGAGSYRVVVKKAGFVPYETLVALNPGEAVNLRARLPVEQRSLTQRWWFWAIAGAVVAGATVGTYFVVRPAPERPAVGGGTLGWSVAVP